MMEMAIGMKTAQTENWGVIERFGAVFVNPGRLFELEAQSPRVGLPIILVFLSGFAAAGYALFAAFPSANAMANIMVLLSPAYISIFAWAGVGILFGILCLFSRIAGFKGPWLPLFSVVCYSQAPILALVSLGAVLTGLDAYNQIAFLGAVRESWMGFISSAETLAYFQGFLHPSNLWSFYLLFLGVKSACSMPGRKSATIVGSLFLLQALMLGGLLALSKLITSFAMGGMD